MSLLQTIEEQVTFGFTGKVNALLENSGQYFATIYLEEGILVGCQYKGVNSFRSLVALIFDDVRNIKKFKYVVEPEIVEKNSMTFEEKFSAVRSKIQTLFGKYKQIEGLIPPMDLKLVINSNFINRGDGLTRAEFDVLSTITEFSRVQDIYKESKLYDHEVTIALVNLRRKKAIKVFK